MAECHMKNETCGFKCTGYDGKDVWNELHQLPKKIHCEECSTHADNLFKGLHDTVNVGLGKKPHYPQHLAQLAKEVSCAYNNCVVKGWCGGMTHALA